MTLCFIEKFGNGRQILMLLELFIKTQKNPGSIKGRDFKFK
jgi:hypothetical protein